MGNQSSRVMPALKRDEILAGLIPKPNPTRIISLDGNIGVGKTTLLDHIQKRFPDVIIVKEPVDAWSQLKDEQGSSLLELFYKDKRRYAFTFQQAAMLSRLLLLQKAVAEAKPGSLILTERSVLTDRFVFAEMLKASGDLSKLEKDLYEQWYNAFATQLPIVGIVYITTSVDTAFERIKTRGREGEATISKEYLKALDWQHQVWLTNTTGPKLEISTEPEANLEGTLVALEVFFNNY